MSLRSGRSRSSATPSSILKKPTLKSRLSEIRQTPNKVRFKFPHAQKVQSILQEYLSKQQSKEYENIICLLRDAELTDDDVSLLLKETAACISLLNQDLRLFVEAILSLDWTSKSDSVVSEYQSFVVNLLSAHNYHTKLVIEKIVKLFIPDYSELEWPDGMPTKKDCKKCSNMHSLLTLLLEVVPMSIEIFINSICTQFPYYNKSAHIHEYYLHNILCILQYQPKLRQIILELIFTRLVVMDINAPVEEIENSADQEMFLMDDETKSVRTSTTGFTHVNRHELGHCLDICLNRVFNYLHAECHNDETNNLDLNKTKKLFDEMLRIFEQVILPTYDTHHVQYVMFYLSSLSPVLTEYFVNYLWKFACNPNKAPVLRQTAVNYIASFVARANCVGSKLLKLVLQNLASWIHSYISTQDELGPINCDVRVHRVFYSICQSIFYVVAFRHKDFVYSKRSIKFLENLNLGRIVSSKLNPLRVCQSAVVQNFAAITRNYQLAYCYTIIEHNTRNKLPIIYQNEHGSVVTSDSIIDTIFPFDPYVLERSGERIQPLYREYQEFTEEVEADMDVEIKETDVDDFLLSHEFPATNNKHLFSYGSSPGFKFNT